MPFILSLLITLFLSFTIANAVTLANKDWVNIEFAILLSMIIL